MSDIRGLFNRLKFNNTVEPDGPWRLLFHCPGCRFVHGPTIGPADPDFPGAPRWSWNGDFVKPEFTPSLLVRWRQLSSAGRALQEEVREREHRVLTDAECAPYWEEKVCHSFIGCNGAAPGQIVFLSDCTHALAGQVVDIPPFAWDQEDEAP